MAYYDSSNKVFERIAAYTLHLEQTPLEEFRTSAEARAVFIKNLNAMAARPNATVTSTTSKTTTGNDSFIDYFDSIVV
jgi:hypothetical protein